MHLWLVLHAVLGTTNTQNIIIKPSHIYPNIIDMTIWLWVSQNILMRNSGVFSTFSFFFPFFFPPLLFNNKTQY